MKQPEPGDYEVGELTQAAIGMGISFVTLGSQDRDITVTGELRQIYFCADMATLHVLHSESPFVMDEYMFTGDETVRLTA